MTVRICLLALSILLLQCAAPPEAEEPEKTNVIILLVDDWGWSDAGVLGSDLYKTPNIDTLAGDGMRSVVTIAGQ